MKRTASRILFAHLIQIMSVILRNLTVNTALKMMSQETSEQEKQEIHETALQNCSRCSGFIHDLNVYKRFKER